jgi:hypothetical protein
MNMEIINHNCCSPSGYAKEEINGECPECGNPTIDEDAYEACSYSPVECKECGWAPCDNSC